MGVNPPILHGSPTRAGEDVVSHRSPTKNGYDYSSRMSFSRLSVLQPVSAPVEISPLPGLVC